MRTGRPMYAVLSGLVYLALIARDIWWEFRQKVFAQKRGPLIAATSERTKWERVRSVIHDLGRKQA